ncbi:MAG: 4-(cytidine 5'-diphospho)-2-C-methyl-D-erythritol kinase [Pseudomonadota bacterium]|jgi:4-diphosphocytidyl-2-C-methyl-D-erythritol kinase|nr:4-(cytidine 5'-diphospho)-2-C-methyl-D-erythritol kinase [Pseudomonadota bacterium]
MERQPWPAPAKINLFLHILGRREDGYHELQTVFQFLSLCDLLYFELRHDGAIHRSSELPGVEPAADLVVRAAQLLQKASGTRLGVDISVEKQLPLGGGLGGGSSDAATTLVALNRLWRLGWTGEALASLGLKLGADVPIFVYGQAAWAEGVGEQFTPMVLDEPWYLVVQPKCAISTAQIFADPTLTRNTPAIKILDFDLDKVRNDCEPLVTARYPEVGEVLDWLRQRGNGRLSGTGSCVFSRYETESQARKALASLPEGWKGFVAKGLNRSPLLERSDLL